MKTFTETEQLTVFCAESFNTQTQSLRREGPGQGLARCRTAVRSFAHRTSMPHRSAAQRAARHGGRSAAQRAARHGGRTAPQRSAARNTRMRNAGGGPTATVKHTDHNKQTLSLRRAGPGQGLAWCRTAVRSFAHRTSMHTAAQRAARHGGRSAAQRAARHGGRTAPQRSAARNTRMRNAGGGPTATVKHTDHNKQTLSLRRAGPGQGLARGQRAAHSTAPGTRPLYLPRIFLLLRPR